MAAEELGYPGELQLILDAGAGRERATVRLDERYTPDGTAARAAFLTAVPELGSAVAEGLLDFTVETADTAAFERTPTSGKLRTVIDRRQNAV